MIEKNVVNGRGDIISVSYFGNDEYWFRIKKRIAIKSKNDNIIDYDTQEIFIAISEKEIEELEELMIEDKKRKS